ncbi:MAG: sulfotransferase family protein [Acidobacteriota bacterium]
MDKDAIAVVSGLPRSGTSMMMNMLVAGGMEALVDNIRAADDDNPKGYFELEKVKELSKDNSWVADARGKVVKVISALLKNLPAGHHYKVVFMRRKMEEILASQRQMLIRRGEPTDTITDEKMAALFSKHLQDIFAWLEQQSNFDAIYVDYNQTLIDPQPSIRRINEFFDGSLDERKMVEAIDRALHRQRK